MKRLTFDIETDALLDKVTVVHSLCIEDVDTGEKWSCNDDSSDHRSPTIAEGLQILEQADVLIGHNILTYDIPALKKLYSYLQLKAEVRDTLVMCRLIYADIEQSDWAYLRKNPNYIPATLIGKHRLGAWGYRVGVLKGSFHENADWSKWTPEMQSYCEQDVVVTTALFKKLEGLNYSKRSVDLEHDFQWIIHLQERHGFKLDTLAVGRLQAKLVARRQVLTEELQRVFPARVETMKTPEWYVAQTHFGTPIQQGATKKEVHALCKELHGFKQRDYVVVDGPLKTKLHHFNPGSRDQIAERLSELGWTPTKFTEGGKPQVDEEVLDQVLEDLDIPQAKLLAEYMIVQKRLGQIAEGQKSWLKYEKNGRVHGAMITNGAVTGRCTHHSPNMAQVPSVKVNKKKEVLWGAEGGYGADCRACWVADDGMVLVGIDASGLELRCLGHFMGFYDGGAYAKIVVEGDIHTTNMKAAGLDLRDKAKTFIYSYLYGAGDLLLGKNAGITAEEIETFKTKKRAAWEHQKTVNAQRGIPTDDKTIGFQIKGGMLRKRFEKETPALAQLRKDIKARVKQFGYLKGLDGRKLRVRHSHAALNTLLQSAGALVVKLATVILYRKCLAKGWTFGKDFANVAHIHDEMQINARPELAEELGQLGKDSIREAGEAFAFNCPLDGEFKVGTNWQSTH